MSLVHTFGISQASRPSIRWYEVSSGGADVDIVGLNMASETLVDRLGVHDKPGALDRLISH